MTITTRQIDDAIASVRHLVHDGGVDGATEFYCRHEGYWAVIGKSLQLAIAQLALDKLLPGDHLYADGYYCYADDGSEIQNPAEIIQRYIAS